MATHGEIRWPSVGLSMAAYGRFSWPPTGDSHGRRHTHYLTASATGCCTSARRRSGAERLVPGLSHIRGQMGLQAFASLGGQDANGRVLRRLVQ